MAIEPARARRSKAPSDDEGVDSFFEIPAAVLCAFCGKAECTGCGVPEEAGSGVIAIIPWERPGSMWSRLWSTSNATTQGAEAFFAAIPDGELSPAMRFAVLAEFLAVTSMMVFLVPLAALALPSLALQVVHSPAMRASALEWLAFGVPALSLWMVIAHVTHGAALDAGARRQGAPSQRRRAMRFGLYACGWDLMAGPLGAIVTAITKGRKAMMGLVDLSMQVPGKASVALLSGVYQLTPNQVTRARRTGAIAAVLLTLVSGLLVVGGVIVAAYR
jgi:hypothetical protein